MMPCAQEPPHFLQVPQVLPGWSEQELRLRLPHPPRLRLRLPRLRLRHQRLRVASTTRYPLLQEPQWLCAVRWARGFKVPCLHLPHHP